MRFLLPLAAVAALACEEKPSHDSPVTAERSQAVLGTATQATPVTPVTATPPPAPASKPRRALCGGKLDTDGKALPVKKPIGRIAAVPPLNERAQAAGAALLPAEPAIDGFTWVNFWAAWCVPCKEEIPRLIAWQERLRAQSKGFKVMFVSLDDDERQLNGFLGLQPANGLRASYWLREGKERTDWLSAAGVDPDPDLPQHLLVDSKGKIRCRIRGAVEDADFDALKALVGGS
jgi:thiol-disulfide isomerase/thioredoxin